MGEKDKDGLSVTFEVAGPLKFDEVNKITGIKVDEEGKYNKLLEKYNKKVNENKEIKEIIYKYGLSKIKKESK